MQVFGAPNIEFHPHDLGPVLPHAASQTTTNTAAASTAFSDAAVIQAEETAPGL
jgi:hypothetical protein